MEPLPSRIKNLRGIKKCLDYKMSKAHTPVEIRATDLYDEVKKNTVLQERFPTPRDFNRFLRLQHDKGVMKQIIPNYYVDTTNSWSYQWKFRKEVEKTQNLGGQTSVAIRSKYQYYKSGKKVIASNGEKLRSKQELFIFESLLKSRNLIIFYDHPIIEYGEPVYVDFFIRNQATKKTFLWEHFGMTNDEKYKDEIADKILWYRNNGYRVIGERGNLIYTYYSDERTFINDVRRLVGLIAK